MMGYFLKHGWIRKNNLINFIIKNNDLVLNLKKVLNDLTERNHHHYVSKNLLWFYILKMFENSNKKKIIPNWVHEAPLIFIKEFIKGFQFSNKHNFQNKNKIITLSKNIALSFQRLYLKLGKIISIEKICKKNSNYYCMKIAKTLESSKSFIEDGI